MTPLYVRGHLLHQIERRFEQTSGETIFAFLKGALENIFVDEETPTRIALVNETKGTVIKARKENGFTVLMTIYPVEECAHYLLRSKDKKHKTTDYSKNPLIFMNTNLQEKNIIKSVKELKEGKIQTNGGDQKRQME